ncbi:hypothetical protein AB4043_13405, partial [Terriglobus sp. YAF25]|uniref:hypothetical protein n=1 Tax=Terriglobus sp. YAF25 TaxID=3233080 RepID=UPI003F9D5CAE
MFSFCRGWTSGPGEYYGNVPANTKRIVIDPGSERFFASGLRVPIRADHPGFVPTSRSHVSVADGLSSLA